MNFKIFATIFLMAFNTNYTQTYTEKFRPQFHYSPPKAWMNDPNGLIFFNGQYHMFYQYYPDDTVWGPMHWGHAESHDLVHWETLPIALYPDQLGWIFSGSAVIDKGNTVGYGKNTMIAIYTYHNDEISKSGKKNPESQGMAYSLDEGKTWTKYSKNPVLNNTGQQDFRDPKVFWNKKINRWTMVLAVQDHLEIFSSPNLKDWTLDSSFKPENDIETGVWECPDLFPLLTQNAGEEKWVAIINHGRKAANGGSGTRYFIGDFDGKTFKNSQPSIWLDYGMDFYAAVTYSNIPDKKIIQGWMSNWLYANAVPTEKWRSAMNLPRELNLTKENNQFILLQKTVPDFEKLKEPIYSQKLVRFPFSKEISLAQTEIDFEIQNPNNDLEIELSNSKNESYTIKIKSNQFTADRRKSGIVDFPENFADKVQTINLNVQKIHHVQMILDQSSAEIFLNKGRFVLSNLYFPSAQFSILKITSGEKNFIKNLRINHIKSIWKK